MVLTGLRGVGKTVLLNEFRNRVERRGWIVVKVEAGGERPFAVMVAQSLNQALRSVAGRGAHTDRLRDALSVFRAFSMKVSPDGSLALGIDVDAARGRADTGDLETDLTELATDLAAAAAGLSIGVAVLIDEMQDLTAPELAAISAACHETGQRGLPFLVVGAGLPGLPLALTEAKSYAERLFEYVSVGPLGPDDSAEAIARPAADQGVSWGSDALRLVVEASDGYPYFLQVFADAVWDYAPGDPITLADADVGLLAARRELDIGFYGSRWDRATPAQRTYLRAVAEGGDAPSSTADVARRLDRRPSDLSVARDQLIKKGLLYAPDRGHIAFTVPGMAVFIDRQPS